MSTQNSHHSIPVLVLLLLLVDISSSKPRPLTIKLIHHNSVSSPYYNPNASPWDLARDAVNSSISRAQYFVRKITAAAEIRKNIKNNIKNNDTNGYGVDQTSGGVQLFPNNIHSGFLANVSIGSPPVPQLVKVDTGSNLLWVNCWPCPDCPGQASPLYDFRRSSTYNPIQCNSHNCNQLGGNCDPTKNCEFEIKYLGGRYTRGIAAQETISFGSEDEGKISVTAEVFGCAHEHGGKGDKQASGIFGLSYDDVSLAKQLGGKFSMCLGDIHKPDYEFNKLMFSDGANLEGPMTPIVSLQHGFYYVSLEGISVAQEKLEIDPAVFKLSPSGHGGTLIDSGTSMTMLTRAAYNVLHDKIAGPLDKYLTRVNRYRGLKKGEKMLCYNGSMGRDIKDFQYISLHLAGGVDMLLGMRSIFLQAKPDVFCLASLPLDGLSIIGSYAHQSYNIGYDVPGGKIYVEQIECEELQS